MQKIPSVDLRDFLSEDPTRKQKFVNEIGKAYEEIGFVALKGHFLDDKLVENLYREVRNFFSLPIETKEKYEIPGIGGQRGYVSFGKEHAKGRSAGDLKEFWQIGQEVEGDYVSKEHYPDNVQISEIHDFNRQSMALYRGFERSGSILLKAIASYLGLADDYFEPFIKNGNSILRAIHYPPILHEPKNSIRAEAHEDINLITLLVGASAEGLEVKTADGSWLKVNAPENHFVVNVGDMLQRLTNNRLKSTTHRVVNPPRDKWHTSRFSMPFFLHPVSEMDLTCLPSCIDNTPPSAYPSITAGDYLTERLLEIGLIKK